MAIDDFGAGSVEVSGNATSFTLGTFQEDLPTSYVLTGRRESRVIARGIDPQPPTTFAIDSGSGLATLITDPDVQFYGGLSVIYTFGGDRFDLDAVGQEFTIQVESANGFAARTRAQLIVISSSGVGVVPFEDDVVALSQDPTQAGVIVIPFEAFGEVDFSRVAQIELRLPNTDPGSTLVLDGIFVTPEPSSLLAAGVASITLLRRRRA